jgi:hypothetical protein
MKYILFVALFLSSFTQSTAQSANAAALSDFNKLSWLTGTWNRTNTKPGRTAHERWEKTGNTEMQGWGVNLKGQDTLFVEKLKLVIKDDHLYYVADVPENKQPVYFKLTEITKESFVCENPDHDFPKKITYLLEGTKLKATISGNGKAIDYWFERN